MPDLHVSIAFPGSYGSIWEGWGLQWEIFPNKLLKKWRKHQSTGRVRWKLWHLALMQNDNPGWNGNRKGSSFESSKAFKSIYALHQIFCLNLMDTEAPKGMPSTSSECVDDLAGLPKNTWSKMDLMPDVLDPGWSDGSNGGCSCADGGFWDVCFKMAAANFSCLLQGKHQPAEYRHTSQGCELQPDWLHCRWR